MRILSTAGGTIRHGLGAAAEAAVVVAIGVTLVFGAAVLTRSDPAGAGSVLAAKGGNGGGSHGAAGGLADALVPSCNPCATGTVVSFTGSGYDPSQGTAILNIAGAWTATAVDDAGNIAFDWPYFQVAGTYSATSYQSRGNNMSIVGQTAVTIE